MRRAAALALALLSLGATSCGGKPPPVAAKTTIAEPRWQDVIDTIPELLVIVRPKALRQDRVFGPLLERAIAAARERSRVVAATTTLQAMEDADEVVLGWRPDTHEQVGETLSVERGVRADIDPAKLVQDDGHAIWSPGPPGPTPELVCEQDEQGHQVDASLFELPGRTWVVVTGAARVRARAAFAHPEQRPPLQLGDPDALALMRVDGPSVVAHVPTLQDRGDLAAVGRHLRSLMMVLPPGSEGAVRFTFTYDDEEFAAFAEVALRAVPSAFANSTAVRPEWAWLKDAKVERPDKRVVMTAPLPPGLIAGLLNAGSMPVGLGTPTPPGH